VEVDGETMREHIDAAEKEMQWRDETRKTEQVT
jgi:hypothetical protein